MVTEENFLDYLNRAGSAAEWKTISAFIPRATREVMLLIGGSYSAEHEEAVNNCICNFAELESAFASTSDRNITSERIGNYSVSYESSESVEQRKNKEKRSALYSWLADTGLLYRGC